MLQVICLEGSGVSSSDKRPLTQAVKSRLCNIRVNYHTFTPFRFQAKCKKILDIYRRTEGPVLIVAKSLGAYRLYKHEDEFDEIWRHPHRRAALITVDPHAPWWICGDGWKRPVEMVMDIPGWVYHKNLFQLDRYPRGACVVRSPNKRIHGTNHTDIVRHPTVRQEYMDAVNWLFRM
jgi:hypothetical protein